VSDALQVQLVRLRFENIPFRVLSRSEFDAWPFAEDSIVIFARTTCSVDDRMPKGVAIASTSPLYMLSDGIERTLSNAMEFSQFHTAAMATRGIWMSSGWNG
jgi:hypothetical protein